MQEHCARENDAIGRERGEVIMSRKAQFEKLLSPCNIGTLQVKNRIIKTAAEVNTHDPHDFHMNQNTIDYIETLAKGGVGMIIFWNAYVDYPLGARIADGLRIDADEYIPGFGKLADDACRTLVPNVAFRAPAYSCFGDETGRFWRLSNARG
jgi:hypothetical protein